MNGKNYDKKYDNIYFNIKLKKNRSINKENVYYSLYIVYYCISDIHLFIQKESI